MYFFCSTFYAVSHLLHPRILLNTFISEFSLCWEELCTVTTLYCLQIFCFVNIILFPFLSVRDTLKTWRCTQFIHEKKLFPSPPLLPPSSRTNYELSASVTAGSSRVYLDQVTWALSLMLWKADNILHYTCRCWQPREFWKRLQKWSNWQQLG
jgi:hypothetical protein